MQQDESSSTLVGTPPRKNNKTSELKTPSPHKPYKCPGAPRKPRKRMRTSPTFECETTPTTSSRWASNDHVVVTPRRRLFQDEDDEIVVVQVSETGQPVTSEMLPIITNVNADVAKGHSGTSSVNTDRERQSK